MEGEKMARDVFFEIPERQIHIFSRFRACQLCKFRMVLRGPWVFLRGLGTFRRSKVSFGGVQGGPEKRGHAPEALQERSGERKLSSSGVLSFPQALKTLQKWAFHNAPKMNVKIVIVFDVDSRRVQDRSQDVFLVPRRGPRKPLVEWIRSKGGLLGGSWISKSSPGLDFLAKMQADFKIFVFRFF